MSDHTTQPIDENRTQPERAVGFLLSGTRIGRLVVLSKIGEGGMGRVYSAYDEALNRRVCLKFLKREEEEESGLANSRLMSEARALAQLSHPFILPIYDVGVHEEQVYLVTEHVDGWNFNQWLDHAEPSSELIIGAYRDAGKGLAAAHKQGIVHRDFKPDNVMIGRDDRVRVMDFGLALSNKANTDHSEGFGTPRYMAPEQLRGEAASALSDQYSYCLSVAANLGVELDKLRDQPELLCSLPLPEAHRNALVRGLNPDPAARHASMDELVSALAPPTKDRQRYAYLALAAGVVGTAALGVHYYNQPALCPLESAPSVVWGTQRPAIQRAFVDTELPYALAAWERITPAVDRFLSDWSAQRQSACRASKVQHVQSDELLDRRMICLDGKLRQLDALGTVFANADANVVNDATRAILKLPDLGACADAQALLSRAPLPSGEAQAENYRQIDEQLSAAWADRQAGRYSAAIAQLEQIQPAVDAFAHLPTQARALALRGDTLIELAEHASAIAAFDRAQFLGLIGGDLGVAADGTLGTAYAHLVSGADAATIEHWYAKTDTLLERLGDQSRRAAWAAEYGQYLIINADQIERGLEQLRFALHEFTELYGADSPRTANVRRSYSWALHRSGDLPGAIEQAALALAAVEAGYGRFHNAYLANSSNYATLLATNNQIDEALQVLQQAHTAGVESVGADHPDVLMLGYTWGFTYYQAQRFAEALPVFEQTYAAALRTLGPQHRLTGGSAAGIAGSMVELGQMESAAAALHDIWPHTEDYPPQIRALVAFHYARALAAIDGSGARIRELIEVARIDGANASEEWRAQLEAFADSRR